VGSPCSEICLNPTEEALRLVDAIYRGYYLEMETGGFDAVNSFIRTRKLSFDQIQKRYMVGARLLLVMAFLDQQDIPRDLLRWSCGEPPAANSALGGSPNILAH
jgi:hypothetical protein